MKESTVTGYIHYTITRCHKKESIKMNRIEREEKDSKEYYLQYYSDNGLVELSRENVAKVEAMIHFNSSYSGEFKKKCEELSDVLWGKKKIKKEEYKELIMSTVIAIDNENSTHLNSDKVGRSEITERLLSLSKSEMIRCLKNPKETNYRLFYMLEKDTSKNRNNPSFASKFCHYMCFYMFRGNKEQDNFSIYDSVVRNALPAYAKYYGIEINKKDLTDYLYYQTKIDAIIKKSGAKISRNGFDHLIWYTCKGKNKEINI